MLAYAGVCWRVLACADAAQHRQAQAERYQTENHSLRESIDGYAEFTCCTSTAVQVIKKSSEFTCCTSATVQILTQTQHHSLRESMRRYAEDAAVSGAQIAEIEAAHARLSSLLQLLQQHVC
jgi:hypothetical protein